MLTGFDKYNQIVQEFEKSKLFRERYQTFLASIARHGKDNPVKSKDIELGMRIGEEAVRKLVRHARLKGFKVGSSEKGYFLAKNIYEYQDTLKHLEERRNMLNCLITKGHEIGSPQINNQTELL